MGMVTTDNVPRRILQWWPEIEGAERSFAVNRYLVGTVMDRESGGGEYLTPKGPKGYGDKGHGLGLMQIDARHHPGFVVAEMPDGTPLWQVPAFNVGYGTWYLGQNIRAYGLLMGIALYNASFERCFDAARGLTVRGDIVVALDSVTADRNYVSDVLRRCLKFGGPNYLESENG